MRFWRFKKALSDDEIKKVSESLQGNITRFPSERQRGGSKFKEFNEA
jgi:hypothetical protein